MRAVNFGFLLREMQHDWPGNFSYSFICKALKSTYILYRSIHRTHGNWDSKVPQLASPVPCNSWLHWAEQWCSLFIPLKEPNSSKIKTSQTGRHWPLTNSTMLWKSPNEFAYADILSRCLICLSDPKCGGFNSCYLFSIWDITL